MHLRPTLFAHGHRIITDSEGLKWSEAAATLPAVPALVGWLTCSRVRRRAFACGVLLFLLLFSILAAQEPFIKVVPIHPARGAVIRWCDLNRGEMVEAVTHFKRKYRVTGETYRYTEEGATAPTLQQVKSLPSGLFSQEAFSGG